MSVKSNENMNLLLEVLSENNPDPNIINTLKKFVINRANSYHRNRLKYGSITDMNKRIIQEGYNYMSKQTKQMNPNDLSQLHSKKSSDFDLRLKEHETNFNSLINGNKPNEINFSDNIEEEEAIPENNMEYLVNQTLADREKELNRITQTYSQDDPKASEWLNSQETTVKLNIEESVPLNDVNKINKKGRRVTFKSNNNDIINNNNNNEIIREIKSFIEEQKINDINDKILERLEIIEKNQKRLLEHFNLIKANPTITSSVNSVL
tara:strand:+ start:4339 stop:5133 length:795 start_codon:yes stop_codon:yes gene_type:complete